MGADVRALISGAMVYAEKAVAADDKLWEARACGQDSEEAEGSGALTGYAEAFRAVYNLLTYNDASRMNAIIEGLKTEAEQAEMQYDEEYGVDSLPDPRVQELAEDPAVTVVAYGASSALLAAIMRLEALWNEAQRPVA